MKYLREIDYLRGFAIISVLMEHTGLLRFESDYNFNALTNFGVPTFLIISGLVLTYVYRGKKLDLKRFYKRRILYTLVPYFIWAFIYTLVWLRPRPTDVSSFLFEFVTRTLTGNWITLWFIVVIFQFYLIFPLLLKLFDDPLKLRVFTVLTFFLTLGMYTMRARSMFPLFREHRLFVPWLFYFMLGMNIGHDGKTATDFLKRSRTKLAVTAIWTVLFLVTPIAEVFAPTGYARYFTPATLLYSSSTAIFLLLMIKPSASFMRFFEVAGICSYGIYLSHRPIMEVSAFLLDPINVFEISIFSFILTTTASLIFVLLIRKLPFGRYIIIGR